MEDIIILLLLAAVMILTAKHIILKKQIRSVSKQLDEKEIRLVTVELTDNDLNSVVQKINDMQERLEQAAIKENLSSAALKSSIVNISHDMKTPLTSVMGYLQLAKKECSDASAREMIEICLERTRYCNSLINDFFELSLIESQGLKPDMEFVDAAGELCEQILINHPLFEEKHITPHFKDSDHPVIVWADKRLLERMIQNLISNSIKYTCGDIYFCVEESKDAVITVSNPVAGKIDTEHIFDKFYVQDASNHSGYGVGLFLCREFAESMGGEICAKMHGNNLSISLRLKKK